MANEDQILAALGFAPDAATRWEPLGESPWSPVLLSMAGESPFEAIIREAAEPEEAQNHAAVAEALANAAFPYVPKLLAVAGAATIEESPPGTTAMQLVPPPGSAEAVMAALAAWHQLPIREGLDWGRLPEDLYPAAEVPLHRLGFAAAEREPAMVPLAEAHAYLLASPFGFAHRNATAANVLLAPAGHGSPISAQRASARSTSMLPPFFSPRASKQRAGGPSPRPMPAIARSRRMRPPTSSTCLASSGASAGSSNSHAA